MPGNCHFSGLNRTEDGAFEKDGIAVCGEWLMQVILVLIFLLSCSLVWYSHSGWQEKKRETCPQTSDYEQKLLHEKMLSTRPTGSVCVRLEQAMGL